MTKTIEEIRQFAKSLQGAGRVAVDTEADSLHCYFEKLCLIQVSIPGRDELIDPLAGMDLSEFYQELGKHELVLHGADFDLRMLRRAGFEAVPEVFDTVIAARLAGYTEFSLAALVLKFFGVELAKGSQKANWAQRPLTGRMLEYAKNDTRYLLTIAEKLERELILLGRKEWFRQSCAKVVSGSLVDRERDPDTLWRITGSHEFRGLGAALLRAIWHWRESEAVAVDRPPFHILQNEKILEIARAAERGESLDLERVRGSRRERLVQAIEAARALPDSAWPRRASKPRLRPTPQQERAFKDLKIRRDQTGSRLRLDPALIAPKAALEALAFQRLAPDAVLLPWQQELLGLNSGSPTPNSTTDTESVSIPGDTPKI